MSLHLGDQLCFPLYAAARAMQQRYRPLLDPLGITYPQYLALLCLWDRDDVPVGTIATQLHLDAATLTPLLQRLEAGGLVARRRDTDDQRVVRVTLTDAGRALRSRAEAVPQQLLASLSPTDLDPHALKTTLDALLRALEPR